MAKRHGITLKPDDPAFAFVTLNQFILEHAMNGLSEQTRNATREFAESLSRLQRQTGSFSAQKFGMPLPRFVRHSTKMEYGHGNGQPAAARSRERRRAG